MTKSMKEMHRNTEIVYADSSDWKATKSKQLLGGIMNILSGSIIEYYNKEKRIIDKLGKWILMQFMKNNKTIGIIIIYRISITLSHRIYSVVTQYNTIEAKIKQLNKYCQEILKEVIEHIKAN